MTVEAGIVWGGVVALRTGLQADAAVRAWAVPRSLRRLLLVHDGAGRPEPLIPLFEAAGLAVFPLAHPGGASVGAVAEAVGAYHFDQCDAVVGLGGDAAVELATLTARMAGQRRPLADLAMEPAALDPLGTAPCMAVATDLSGVAALGGARLLIDDRGCPFLIRDPLLRPDAAAWCPELEPDDRRRWVAALSLDAGNSLAAERVMSASVAAAPAEALEVAATLERRLGPGRVFAALGEVSGERPPGPTLGAVLMAASGAGGTADPLLSLLSKALDPTGDGRAGLDALPLDGLAHLDPATLPVDISGVLVMLGRDIPARRRRGGRGGAARGRRTE
ncbi:iron-containing alcohol dehydrogenase [Thalassobaculum sp. OXR-137]|uniref:iron-containing alcohol dehydrogenase n=1 Tax=Thalassobaculum sp. OXR-137 TaxID=3100173 RepID=UPI002AC9499D|nr:iron-containing alcohol dehydrogenase [Thalassobaculum sp. OXR-137]WPZ33628.1 iron-containing alcohol dehydrogenase [Thalassobaculum sp. OXR-137]